MRTSKKPQTEIFICDSCGQRKRLEAAKRHWCDVCKFGVPVEMRCARDKWRRPGQPDADRQAARF